MRRGISQHALTAAVAWPTIIGQILPAFQGVARLAKPVALHSRVQRSRTEPDVGAGPQLGAGHGPRAVSAGGGGRGNARASARRGTGGLFAAMESGFLQGAITPGFVSGGRAVSLERSRAAPATEGEAPSFGDLRCVALLSPGWPPNHHQNGIVTYTAQTRAALRARGVRTIILSLLPPTAGDPDVVPLATREWRQGLCSRLVGKVWRRTDGWGWYDRAVVRSIVRALERLKTETGLQLLEMEDSYGWSGEVAQLSPVPVFTRLQGPWFEVGPASGLDGEPAYRHRERKEGAALRRVAGLIAPAHTVLERVRAHYGADLPPTAVVQHPIRPVPAALRWQGERCDPRRILFVGRFDRCKGGDVVLRAFRQVHATHPDARLDFVGPDRGLRDEHGRMRSLAEFMRDELPADVAQHVFVHGSQPVNATAALRRKCGMCVVASRYETTGYTALEALALGCPLIAARAGGLVETVQDGVTGLLFESGNPDDLARCLRRLLDDRALAERLGREAVGDVAMRYDPDRLAARTLRFYQSVLAGECGAGLAGGA